MKKPELLAPAGNMESLYAAIEAGCDAVYLGGYTFGARAYAGNFSLDEMKEAVRYAHLYGVKVYVTVNTVIYESEIEMLLDYVDELVKIHVDALIIQDLGAFDLIHQIYPDLELHASTQMHIHNVSGALMMEKLGAKRVVLARETPIEVVREVKKKTKIEVEIFVHGALCVSYSGQCLMSSLIGGRSGNRGSCAGSCRQKYTMVELDQGKEKVVKEESYLLSMKDLNTLEHLSELIDAGVESFKIEGRMKSPSYVYCVVSLYREAIDSYLQKGKVSINQKMLENLSYIFHRRFTKGFLFHEDNDRITNPFRPNHLGVPIGKVAQVKGNRAFVTLSLPVVQKDGVRIIGKEDTGCFLNVFYKNGKRISEANAGDTISFDVKGKVEKGATVVKTYDEKLVCSIQDEIDARKRKVPIWMHVILRAGDPMILNVTDGKNEVKVESSQLLEEAKKTPTSKDRIREQLERLGNTVYRCEEITFEQQEDIFLPISVINEVRRLAISKLDDLRLERPKLMKKEYRATPISIERTENIEVYFSTQTQYERLKDCGLKLITDIENKEKYQENMIWKLPNVIEKYPKENATVMVEEVGGLESYSDFVTGVGFNVCNSYTVHLLHKLGAKEVTLSYECNDIQIEELMEAYFERYQTLPNVAMIVRSVPRMMTTKYRLLEHGNPQKQYFLKDRFHNLYPIYTNRDGMHLYFDHVVERGPIQNYREMGIQNFRYEYLPPERVDGVLKIPR